jgi:hypothetical protein
MAGDWQRRLPSRGWLEVAQTQLQAPAPGVEGDDLPGGIALGIQQGGQQGDPAVAEAADGGAEADEAHGDLRGHALPLPGGENPGLHTTFEPDKKPVAFGQAFAFAEIHFALVMQARDDVDPPAGQLGGGGVFPKSTVPQHNIPGLEKRPQPVKQAQIMAAQTVEHHLPNGPAAQGHERYEAQDGKAATGLLGRGLGITPLIAGGVGQLGGGTIDHQNPPARQLARAPGPSFRALSGGAQGLFEPWTGQSLAGLDIGAIALLNGTAALETEQGLDLADDLATGGLGIEHLPDETFEGQAQAEDALAAVGTILFGGEERGGQQVAQVLLELGQGVLAQGVGGAVAEGGQLGAPGGEAGSMHE